MPTGTITFLSQLYNGAISDLKLVQICKLIDKLTPGDDVMADPVIVALTYDIYCSPLSTFAVT